MKRSTVRYVLTFILIGVLTCGITACGAKVADESQIKQELESNQQFRFLQDGETIDEVVIEKRQTDKEKKTDMVWCSVSTSDMEVAYQKNVVLTYGLYDKEGWILDDVDVDSEKQWGMTPLKGINESDAVESLYGHTVIVDNEEWTISKDNLTKTVIENQETDLDGKTDRLIIQLTIDDKVERAEGKIEVSYFFNQGWTFDSILSNDAFEVSMKEEYALNVEENDLISKVTETEITFGEGSSKQVILTKAEEVSDFKIDEHSTESKGCRQIYQCSYNLNTPHAVLGIKAVLTYVYQDESGWTASVSEATAKVILANIEGDWIGTYKDVPFSGKAELHISEMQEDGSVTATYKFTPEYIDDYSSVGSYELSGQWDSENLELFLEAGEWIEQPKRDRISNSKQNITAVLIIEKGQLEGKAQGGNTFKVNNTDETANEHEW